MYCGSTNVHKHKHAFKYIIIYDYLFYERSGLAYMWIYVFRVHKYASRILMKTDEEDVRCVCGCQKLQMHKSVRPCLCVFVCVCVFANKRLRGKAGALTNTCCWLGWWCSAWIIRTCSAWAQLVVVFLPAVLFASLSLYMLLVSWIARILGVTLCVCWSQGRF